MSGHGEILQQAAFDAIEDNGEPVTFKRLLPGAYDPITGSTAELPPLTFQRMAMVAKMPVGGLRAFDGFQGGTLTQTFLREVMVAGLDIPFNPASGDIVEFDDTAWTCVGLTVERAEGLDIAFSLTVKR